MKKTHLGLPTRNPSAGKISIYFQSGTVEEIRAEAARLGVPMSQVMQMAWRIARDRLQSASVHSTRAAS